MSNELKKDSLTSLQVTLMAIAAGVSVANIYYNQPILQYLCREFHQSEANVGMTSMLAQIGYGLGLFFLIPLGDMISRRKTVLTLLICLVVSLVGMAAAPSLWVLFVLSVVLGVLSVTPQILIPLAAELNQASRGKTVGTILSGLLIGILAARVMSGFIADYLGWRSVYIISASMTVLVIIGLYKQLPDSENHFQGNYLQLLQSTLSQFKRFVELREAALLGAMLFGIFCSFWTTLTFHLTGAPFHYSAKVIGLFGLVAIVGALLAPIIGKLNDRGKKQVALYTGVSLVIVSILIIKLFPHSLLGLIIAIILLDVGIQGVQVTNSSRIYALDAASGSRINTIFMTLYFLGGALGTAIGLYCWNKGGWDLVTTQMLLLSIVGACIAVIGFRIRKKKGLC